MNFLIVLSYRNSETTDSWGINPRSFDGDMGILQLGIPEQIVFPEIDYDKIDRIRGLDIDIVNDCGN